MLTSSNKIFKYDKDEKLVEVIQIESKSSSEMIGMELTGADSSYVVFDGKKKIIEVMAKDSNDRGFIM